jgi:hypothetical protein
VCVCVWGGGSTHTHPNTFTPERNSQQCPFNRHTHTQHEKNTVRAQGVLITQIVHTPERHANLVGGCGERGISERKKTKRKMRSG